MLQWTSFNQDNTCISIGTSNGYRIFRIFNGSVECVAAKESRNAGLKIVQMLYNTNLLALVGINSAFPPNNLRIWDAQKCQKVMEIEFDAPVINVEWSKEWLVAILKTNVHVYYFPKADSCHQVYETCENNPGIASLADGANPQ